ncbi:MAG: ribosome small subunit-dependent GTPase A, partial [Actinomycetota bacterium]|nr:ribosome small subunit-dependent GTPase A [Actinomycetota bacterium]
MTDSDGPDLPGWDSSWAAAFAEVAGPDCRAGRVARVDRGVVLVLTRHGPVRASLGSGLLDRIAADPTVAPCTGDWCAVRPWPDGPLTV